MAKEKGLFEKEGLRPEITVYRGGGETFEAIAANSADLGPVAVPLVATSRKRGVLTKIVGGNGDEWSGWILGVRTGSPVKSVKELDGKKVGHHLRRLRHRHARALGAERAQGRRSSASPWAAVASCRTCSTTTSPPP